MTDIEAVASPAELATGSAQYLTFALGAEEYGIEILKVQEIKGFTGVTPIPNTLPHIKGVMNLRGSVIPVVDLRAKFSMATAEYTKFTVIVVVNISGKSVGLIVDAVSDVVDIRATDVRTPPALGARPENRFIVGMADIAGKMCVLLDVQKLLSDDDIVSIEAVAR